MSSNFPMPASFAPQSFPMAQPPMMPQSPMMMSMNGPQPGMPDMNQFAPSQPPAAAKPPMMYQPPAMPPMGGFQPGMMPMPQAGMGMNYLA